jgi:uncharacterized iron-regulated membrane protein
MLDNKWGDYSRAAGSWIAVSFLFVTEVTLVMDIFHYTCVLTAVRM